MLRITVHQTPEVITFKLEGKLNGEGVQVLRECWQSAVNRKHNMTLRVDLADVTSIDDMGRGCLVLLHREGAQLFAVDCHMKAIVSEVTAG